MNNTINEIIILYMNTDEETRKQIRDVLIYLENLNASTEEKITD